jgi:hypothetical protein
MYKQNTVSLEKSGKYYQQIGHFEEFLNRKTYGS